MAGIRFIHNYDIVFCEKGANNHKGANPTFDVPDEMVGSMVTVGLPPSAGSTDDDAAKLRLALLVEDRIEVQLHAWRRRLWVRISAQVYNEPDDIERLAGAVARRLRF